MYSQANTALQKSLSAHLHEIYPKLLQVLSEAMEEEAPADIMRWKEMLRGKPVLWTGDRFIEVSRIAFQVWGFKTQCRENFNLTLTVAFGWCQCRAISILCSRWSDDTRVPAIVLRS